MPEPTDRPNWADLAAQRQAVLRSLTYVNLQISALREDTLSIEERIRSLEDSWPYGTVDEREAA